MGELWMSTVLLVFRCTAMCLVLQLPGSSQASYHPPFLPSLPSLPSFPQLPARPTLPPFLQSLMPSRVEPSTPPPVYQKPEIYSLHIYSDIKYRFATTLVTSRVKNPSEKSQEAVFDVTLPNEAFITNFTIEMDGKIVVGEIKEKEKAKKQYQAAQARGESAGYIGTAHRETNKFNLAITVAAMSKVSFNLTYQELLKRKSGHYEQVIYIDPGQTVPDMDITVSIMESRNITKLAVPPLRNDVGADLVDLNSLAVISQPTPKTAYVKYVPNVMQQKEQSTNGIAGQFVVQYDVERHMDAGDILIVNGYFVHFFAPEGLRPLPNDVLFILDTSGSMMGTKLAQMKQAMKSILRQMNEADRFNIMAFSGSTSLWKTQMVDVADEDIMEEAKRHVNKLRAIGMTNINAALTEGIQFLADASTTDSSAPRSPIIIFLTDGDATRGVTNPQQIINNVKAANEGGIPIFSLAFGEDADYDTIKKIAIQNNGFGRKIYEASDAALQIAGLYNEVSITLLNNITFKYLDAPVANVTKNEYRNYYKGSEVIICGILSQELFNETKTSALRLEVSSNSYDGPNVLVLPEPLDINMKDDTQNLTKLGDYESITEKVWAYLTIKQLLDKELVSSNQTEKEAYKEKILELSLKYGFVTPLTSMVVTKSDEEKTVCQVVDDILTPTKPVSAQRAHGQSNPSVFRQYSPPQLHTQMSQWIDDPVPALFSYHSVDAGGALSVDDDDSAPQYSVPSTKRKGQPMKNRKNKGKGKSRARNVYRAPLQVQFPGVDRPICFNMYTSAVASGEKQFVLYRNEINNVTVTVTLKNQSKRRLKQSGITALTITDTDTVETITSNNKELKSYPLVRDGWSVYPDMNGTKAVALRLVLGDMEIYIRPIKGDLLNLQVTTFTNTATDDGILGEILSTRLKLKKTKTKPAKGKKPAREIALLRVNKRMVTAVKRPFLDAALANGKDACWEPRKHESKFYTIDEYIRV